MIKVVNLRSPYLISLSQESLKIIVTKLRIKTWNHFLSVYVIWLLRVSTSGKSAVRFWILKDVFRSSGKESRKAVTNITGKSHTRWAIRIVFKDFWCLQFLEVRKINFQLFFSDGFLVHPSTPSRSGRSRVTRGPLLNT